MLEQLNVFYKQFTDWFVLIFVFLLTFFPEIVNEIKDNMILLSMVYICYINLIHRDTIRIMINHMRISKAECTLKKYCIISILLISFYEYYIIIPRIIWRSLSCLGY